MPESVARFLLKRRWIIRPGLESSDPFAAVEQYMTGLLTSGKTLIGKRVLVFGYGGRFAVGVELLRRGAVHVVLCDHFVLLDRERNLELLPEYKEYLVAENDNVRPRAEYITLLHGDIREESIQKQIAEVDVVLSTSVYEHLDDVRGITQALAKLTAPAGIHLHFVDLRDHFFKYPFEMLTFSESTWRKFLNPTSNLNRFRLTSYREVFDAYFKKVDIKVLERLENEFRAVRSRIHPEFLTGDDAIDSVGLIQVLAQSPLPKREG
jgi:SAM-dependent methyltransferase